MIEKRRVLVNALVSLVQVVVNGGAFLLLYRFLYDTIGVDDLGVWAVVLAWAQVNHLANLGMTGSAVKYVAMYRARGEDARVGEVIETSVVSVAVVLAVVLVLMYPLLRVVLAFFIEPASKVPAALSILPYALVGFWLAAVAGVLQSCIDGFLRVDVRNLLVMGAAVVYLVLAVLFVPEGGLIGLARAQVLQAGLLCVAAWLVVRRMHRGLSLVPVRWDRATFREMLRYSLTFQGMSILQMLLEPVTKSLLSKFGSVSASGFFELANKMVVQLRALVATAHWAIVPTIADLQERSPALIQDIYRKSFRLVLFLVLGSLPLLLGLTPLISRLWLGTVEPMFVFFSLLIAAGWFLNMLSNPAYFDNFGTGRLRWNMWDHAITGALNVLLGVVLGWQFGGLGVVVAFVVALMTGSVVLVVAYQREHSIRFAEVIRRDDLVLGVAAVCGLVLVLVLYAPLNEQMPPVLLTALVVAAYGVVVAWPLWRHGIRQQVQGWWAVLRQRATARTSPEP